MAGKKVIQVVGVSLLSVALLCCVPVYFFFWYCPVPDELLAVKRQIHAGMKVEEVEALLPGGFTRYPAEMALAGDRDYVPRGLGKDEGFTGILRGSEMCSDQCDGRLEVTCRKGVVVEATLDLWNDFKGTSTPIE